MEPEAQQPEPQQEKRARPQLMSPQVRNLIVGTAIAVILLTVTAWAGSINTENAKRETLRNDVAALAASFKYPLLEANSLRSDAGFDRLEPMLLEIARAGEYRALVLTDSRGKVIATTKGELGPEDLDSDDLPENPTISRSATGLNAAAPIKLADSTLGYLFVETSL